MNSTRIRFCQSFLRWGHLLRTRSIVTVLVVASVVTALGTTIVVKQQCEQEPDHTQVVADAIQSKNLAERRDLIISLPESYQRETARRYPVLYVLDGSSQTEPTAESARLMARIGVMPEIIVVGIPSSSENRARDYTPQYMHADAERTQPLVRPTDSCSFSRLSSFPISRDAIAPMPFACSPETREVAFSSCTLCLKDRTCSTRGSHTAQRFGATNNGW